MISTVIFVSLGPKPLSRTPDSSHFAVVFLVMIALLFGLYALYHNRQKVGERTDSLYRVSTGLENPGKFLNLKKINPALHGKYL
jgi:hypothetical protein